MADGEWMFFEHDAETHKTTYMRILEDGRIQMQDRIPMWLATQLMDANKARAADFTQNGGWHGAKNGAVVAAIPHHLDRRLKELSGFDPLRGGEYDRDRYARILDDSDYQNLRTGGGKIGRRKAMI